MAKRKSDFDVESWLLQEMAGNSLREVVHRTPGKRQRRTSDVIDSMGDSPLFSPASTSSGYFSGGGGPSTPSSSIGVVTPKRPTHTSTMSPDLGYYTPDLVNTTEWAYSQPVSSQGSSQLAGCSQRDNTQRVSSQQDTSVCRLPSSMFELSQRSENGNRLSGSAFARMAVERNSRRYNMQHRNRGKCVVFNHESFANGFPLRQGTSYDVRRIQETFQGLGFSVEICDDYKHNAIVNKINELSAEDHSDNDCLCIFVLTHGTSHDLISAKDTFYNSDEIWKPFTANRCTTLAGKPKLFFFQACRGDNLDGGVHLNVNRVSRTEPDSFSWAQGYTLPHHADFLIAHSTPSGFYSWRDTNDGTWFISSLCDILNEYAESTDLLDMLTMTSWKVAIEFSSIHIDPSLNHQKQIPAVTSMLTRKLYFNPIIE